LSELLGQFDGANENIDLNCRLLKYKETESLKNAQNRKIENVAGLI
jgi:hypothetical protein